MKKILIVILTGAFVTGAIAQETKAETYPIKKGYALSASELILSWGDVKAPGLDISPIVRFSAFFHLGEQFHYDFNKNFGMYTGFSLRNVGMINDLNDSVRIKQRAYTLGVPLALKAGNMNGFHIAAGAEAELAFAYKQKVFVNDEKSKSSEWFSDRVNLFQPSVFGELHFPKGAYVKFKYYLTDFLVEDKQKTNVTNLVYKPSTSKMMYVSFGFALSNEFKKAKKEYNSQKKI